MDHKAIYRLATELEKELTEEEIQEKPEVNELDERIEDEKQEVKVPETPLSASITANYHKLIKMAKQVKESKMDAETKKAYLAKIKQASEKLAITRMDLKKNISGDPASMMKKIQQVNKLTRDDSSLKPIRELISEIGQNFPMSLLNKPLGSCSSAEIIKLGPMLASLISQYEKSKAIEE